MTFAVDEFEDLVTHFEGEGLPVGARRVFPATGVCVGVWELELWSGLRLGSGIVLVRVRVNWG